MRIYAPSEKGRKRINIIDTRKRENVVVTRRSSYVYLYVRNKFMKSFDCNWSHLDTSNRVDCKASGVAC